MQILSNIFLLVQIFACIAALFFWKQYKHTPLWIFLPYLIYTVLNELTATVMVWNEVKNVRILYNVYCAVSFGVYLYFFDQLIKLKFWKWLILLGFVIVILTDIFQRDVTSQLIKNSLLFLAILLFIFSLIYFIKLLNSKEVIHYQKIPEFWIIFGILVFHIAFIPLSLVSGSGYNIQLSYSIVILILNYLMYSCYIYGFYVAGKR